MNSLSTECGKDDATNKDGIATNFARIDVNFCRKKPKLLYDDAPKKLHSHSHLPKITLTHSHGQGEVSVTLRDVVQEMLREKGLDSEATEWILRDISPRIAFLDGSFPLTASSPAPGMSNFFATAIRKAFEEIIDLEIELYQVKRCLKGDRQ